MHAAFQFEKWKEGDYIGVIGVDERLKGIGSHREYWCERGCCFHMLQLTV
jgi:hypothetical protein